MSADDVLGYQREELRKMLVAIVDSCKGKIEVSYSSYGSAGKRTLHIEPHDARQAYVLTIE